MNHLRMHNRHRRGFALVVVMWVIVMSGLMLLGSQWSARTNLAMAHNELEGVRARWLARAAVEQAMATLEDDSASSDDASDFWYSDESAFGGVELTGGLFRAVAPPGAGHTPNEPRYGLIDHCGLLNLNTAAPEMLKNLDLLDNPQIECLIDWRDGDNNPHPNGAEDAFYARLDYPYEIRNGPMLTLGEILLVREFSRATAFGEDANLNGLLDVNEDDGAVSLPDDDSDGMLQRGLFGLATVYSYELNRDASGAERININTADKQKLMDELNLSSALAEAIANTGSKGGEGSSRGDTSDSNKSEPAQGESAQSEPPDQGSRQPSGGGKGAGSDKQQRTRFSSLMDLLKVKPQASSSKSGDDDGERTKEITLKWLAEHIDRLTLSDDERLDGRINVNTAPREVLMALPKIDASTAEGIVRRQFSGKGPFSDVGDLLLDGVLSEEQFKAVAELVTVRSSVFEVRGEGVTSFGVRGRITAIIDRHSKPMSVIYWSQSE